jgi:hypothetical protein
MTTKKILLAAIVVLVSQNIFSQAPCIDASMRLLFATVYPSDTVQICAGGKTILSANTGSGLTYQWYKDGNAIDHATNSELTVYASNVGQFYVVVSNESGCSVQSEIVTVERMMSPSASIITESGNLNLCSGSVTLQEISYRDNNSKISYQWKRNGSDIQGATANVFIPVIAGDYAIKTTNLNDCSKVSDPITIRKTCESSEQPSAPSPALRLYPNPNDGQFIVYSKLYKESASATIEVINFIGETIYSETTAITDGVFSKRVQLDADNPSGIYFLKLETDDIVLTKKIEINR